MDRTYPHKKVQSSKPSEAVSTNTTPAELTSNETASDSANSANSVISIGLEPQKNLLPMRPPVILTDSINTDENPSTESVHDTGAPSSGYQANTVKSSPQAMQTDVEFTRTSVGLESPNGLSISPSRCPTNLDFQTAVRAVISETKVQEICNGQLVHARIPWETSDDRVTVWVNCSFILQQ